MDRALRNRLRYSPESSRAIGTRAGQQRQAQNAAIEYTLVHPNVSKYGVQRQLTIWRQANPARWQGSVSVQRPGLYRGRNSVRLFDEAGKAVLAETRREVRLAQSIRNKESAGNARPPRHGARPERDINPDKLFRSRKGRIALIIEDATRIRQTGPSTLTVDRMELQLARPIPENSDIRTVQILERESSTGRGRNRPLASRSYEINLVIREEDPDEKDPWTRQVGLDAGVNHLLTDSDGQHYDIPGVILTNTTDRLGELARRQKRLKRGGRQWLRLQKLFRAGRRKRTNIRDNWEHHVAGEITQANGLVVIEDLKHKNMRSSSRGTPENPGRNVRAKSGLNRSLANARPGAMQVKVRRHCEKRGTWLVRTDPRHTSQTCSQCGYRHRENRKSQAEFECRRCLTRVHADVNAAVNILRRGREFLLLYRNESGSEEERVATKLLRRMGIPPSSDSPTSGPTPVGSTLLTPSRTTTGPKPLKPEQRGRT